MWQHLIYNTWLYRREESSQIVLQLQWFLYSLFKNRHQISLICTSKRSPLYCHRYGNRNFYWSYLFHGAQKTSSSERLFKNWWVRGFHFSTTRCLETGTRLRKICISPTNWIIYVLTTKLQRFGRWWNTSTLHINKMKLMCPIIPLMSMWLNSKAIAVWTSMSRTKPSRGDSKSGYDVMPPLVMYMSLTSTQDKKMDQNLVLARMLFWISQKSCIRLEFQFLLTNILVLPH